MNKHTSHAVPSTVSAQVDLTIHARPSGYRLAFSIASEKEVDLGYISAESLTMRKSGKESPNAGAHFDLFAQGAYGFPCQDPAIFMFAGWKSI